MTPDGQLERLRQAREADPSYQPAPESDWREQTVCDVEELEEWPGAEDRAH